ncbi:Os10g0176550 [Oryza sativa Japonica Group]|uniref:Os10g0176550 protein n=1 Tax=Oryza sativa subsp. japonica TaxID=39947 RepID=A0A0P0XS39_ORYSJ|nr:hypothetical protein DAI22_10g038750 [Oryza sativa Japonica Group]BAT10095.1 Os10g0176550 [Oryza sativa Japonica Group]
MAQSSGPLPTLTHSHRSGGDLGLGAFGVGAGGWERLTPTADASRKSSRPRAAGCSVVASCPVVSKSKRRRPQARAGRGSRQAAGGAAAQRSVSRRRRAVAARGAAPQQPLALAEQQAQDQRVRRRRGEEQPTAAG